MPKGSQGLLLIVLEDGKGALVQVRNQVMVLVVDDGRVNYDFFDFLLEDKNSAVAGILLLVLGLFTLSLFTLGLSSVGLLSPGGLSRTRLSLALLAFCALSFL